MTECEHLREEIGKYKLMKKMIRAGSLRAMDAELSRPVSWTPYSLPPSPQAFLFFKPPLKAFPGSPWPSLCLVCLVALTLMV